MINPFSFVHLLESSPKTVANQSNPLPKLKNGCSIIILTWNGLEFTKQCLKSLEYLSDNPLIEIIVFDNGSNDGTKEYLQSLDWIKPIFNQTNIGYTAGNNVAILRSIPENDIILLNNDAVIRQSNWIHLLQETAYSSANIGIVGCRILDGSGKYFLHGGTYIYPDTCIGRQIGELELDVNQFTSIRDVQGIVFACAYIKRELINEIGYLDTRYFAYLEDTDYCLSALSKKYRVVFDGRVTLNHYHRTSTKVNQVDLLKIYLPSQNQFCKKWQHYLNNEYTYQIAWRSAINLPLNGYVETSKNLILALDQEKIKITYQYAYGPGTMISQNESPLNVDPRIEIIRSRSYHPGHVEVVYGWGNVFFKNQGRYKVGFTMLEVDGLPQDWVDQCNSMDEVWVPSNFNVDTFKSSGVIVPINIVPLGIDPNYLNPTIKGTRFSEKFTFLSVFTWGERKNPAKLLESFCKAFSNKDDVILICKIDNTDRSINVQEEIRKLNLNTSNIIILYNQKLPNHLIGSLYRSVDCFVLPTRGEGWGMPILEAMACGIPTIATNWSGQTEFLNSQTGYPIRVKKLIPVYARCPFYKGFHWAEPDYDHLIELMRHVYNNRDEAQKRSLQVADDILAKWTWENSAKVIKKRIASYF